MTEGSRIRVTYHEGVWSSTSEQGRGDAEDNGRRARAEKQVTGKGAHMPTHRTLVVPADHFIYVSSRNLSCSDVALTQHGLWGK